MVGFLGTIAGLINGLQSVSYEKSMGLNALPGAIADALVVTAMGLVIGIAAHWVAAFVEGGKPVE